MVASSWVLRANPEVKAKVERWLAIEATGDYVLFTSPSVVEVDFQGIDDAFRFRLQFDEELLA